MKFAPTMNTTPTKFPGGASLRQFSQSPGTPLSQLSASVFSYDPKPASVGSNQPDGVIEPVEDKKTSSIRRGSASASAAGLRAHEESRELYQAYCDLGMYSTGIRCEHGDDADRNRNGDENGRGGDLEINAGVPDENEQDSYDDGDADVSSFVMRNSSSSRQCTNSNSTDALAVVSDEGTRRSVERILQAPIAEPRSTAQSISHKHAFEDALHKFNISSEDLNGISDLMQDFEAGSVLLRGKHRGMLTTDSSCANQGAVMGTMVFLEEELESQLELAKKRTTDSSVSVRPIVSG